MIVINDVELQEPTFHPEDSYYRTPLKPNSTHLQKYQNRYLSEDDRSSDYDYEGNSINTITPDTSYPTAPPSGILYPRRIDKEGEFTCFSVLNTLTSLVSYIVDFGSDLAVCYFLYKDGQYLWFGLTAVVVILSAVVVNLCSLRWYVNDERERTIFTEVARRPRLGLWRWLLRIIFHLILLGPVVRYLDLLIYGLRSRRNVGRRYAASQDRKLSFPARVEQPDEVDYYLLMIHEDRDTALLTLIQGFMESAPQLVLQIYFLAEKNVSEKYQITEYLQIISIASSLFEISWGLASYHRALRRSVPEKRNMTFIGTALQFLWCYCIIASRVVALAFFASEYKYWLFPLCIGHWGVMSVWIMHQQTRFCDTDIGEARPCQEYLFNMVIGAVYLFCFLNVKDEPTRHKYTAFYIISFIENISMIILWYFKCDISLWYRYPALFGVIGAFFLGIFFMLVYYRYFHPNGRMPLYNRSAKCC